MSHRNILRGVPAATAALLALLLLFGASAALATDRSNIYMAQTDQDNHSDGYLNAVPQPAWRGFDMVFHQGQIWQSFYQAGPTNNLKTNTQAVTITSTETTATPEAKPEQHRVLEGNDTWINTQNRVTADRLAVFKDRLFLYVAKHMESNKGMALFQKELDGANWAPEPLEVWKGWPLGAGDPGNIKGLVVKVINDKLHIFAQRAGTRDLYLITSENAHDFSAAQKIFTFPTDDCLLNGDVVARASDGKPVLAFVTKDDAVSGVASNGHMKLWTFDPAAAAGAQVALVTAVPEHFKDMTIVAGNVSGCVDDNTGDGTDYSKNAVQLWGIGWGSQNVYHMQFLFNANAASGSFNPAGILDSGNASTHVQQTDRGYLAACLGAYPVVEEVDENHKVTSFQQSIRVWWWGSVNFWGTDAFGRSNKYDSDYLHSTGQVVYPSKKTDINDAWQLQGIITGVAPYYANGTEIGHTNANNFLSYGISQTNELATEFTSGRTISVGFSQDLFGIGSIGFGYSNSLERSTKDVQSTTISKSLGFGPGEVTEVLNGIPRGAQAWGIFLVPDLSNEQYHLMAPDRTTDLGVDINYTYLMAGPSSLKASLYDMTQRGVRKGPETAGAFAFFQGVNFKTFPLSTYYWDWQDVNDLSPFGDDHWEHIVSPVSVGASSVLDHWEFLTTGTHTESSKSTNTVNVDSGIFGVTLGLKGELTFATSNSTTYGTNLRLDYGTNAYELASLPRNPDGTYDLTPLKWYLSSINMTMYWLRAKDWDAFFVPDGAKVGDAKPWCITWRVDDFVTGNNSTEVTDTPPPAQPFMVSMVRSDISNVTQLPAGLRSSLISKLEGARAAYLRGQIEVALNKLGAARNQIEAQAGKAIPMQKAKDWIQIIDYLNQLAAARR